MIVGGISDTERAKMLKAHSIGPKMVSYLEQSGIRHLHELADRKAADVLFQIEVETGVKLNVMGERALENLINLARQK